MPVWLTPIIIKMVSSAILDLLVKSGFINSAEAEIGKGAVSLEQGLKTIQTQRQFPSGKPNDPFGGVNQ